MRVLFAEPPAHQAVGGLDLAIDTFSQYLLGNGVSVERRVSQIRQAHGFDLVHFHGLWQPSHSILSFRCRRRGVPYIISPHGMLEPWAWRKKSWKKRPYYALVEGGHLNGALNVLATSEQEQENLLPFVPARSILTIPLALRDAKQPDYERARRILGWDEGERVLVYLSRVHPKKGLHLLLEALAGLSQDHVSRSRLVIVGCGPRSYEERIWRFIRENQSGLPAVDWVGAVWGEEKWPYLQGADLMCLPTYSENFGYAVLEACQVGTPILTTTTTPWHFITDWGAGFVIDPHVQAIRAALLNFFERFEWNSTLRTELSNQVRRRFDAAELSSRYLTVVSDACS